jgi:hypothetical protein
MLGIALVRDDAASAPITVPIQLLEELRDMLRVEHFIGRRPLVFEVPCVNLAACPFRLFVTAPSATCNNRRGRWLARFFNFSALYSSLERRDMYFTGRDNVALAPREYNLLARAYAFATGEVAKEHQCAAQGRAYVPYHYHDRAVLRPQSLSERDLRPPHATLEPYDAIAAFLCEDLNTLSTSRLLMPPPKTHKDNESYVSHTEFY